MEGHENNKSIIVKSLVTMYTVGVLSLTVISIVSIIRDQPISASLSGSGGLALSVGAKALTGGKVGW